MNVNIFTILILISSFISLSYQQEVRNTIANGNWHATTTWANGIIPSDNDDVVITHSLTLNALVQVNQFTMRANRFTLSSGSATLIINGLANISGLVQGTGVVIANGDVINANISGIGIRLTTATSRLDLGANVDNSAMKFLEANVVRMINSNTRSVSGIIQTNKISELHFTSDAGLSTGAAGSSISLGGKINMNGYTIEVVGGDVNLVGTEIGGGVLSVFAENANINVNPDGSTMTINGLAGAITQLNAAAGGFVKLVASRAIDVSNTRRLVVNNLQLFGELKGTNGSVEVTNLLIEQTGSASLSGISSRLDILGNILNTYARDLAADRIVLSGVSSRVLSGVVQTRSTGSLVFDLSQDFTSASDVASPMIKLGGKIVGQGYTISVPSNSINFTLNAASVSNAHFRSGASIIVTPPSTAFTILDTALVSFTTGVNSESDGEFVYVAAGKRIDVSGGRSVQFDNLYLFGSLYGTGSSQVDVTGNLIISSTGSASLSGGASMLSLSGNVENFNTADSSTLQADTIKLACNNDERSTSASRIVSGLIQSMKTGALLMDCDVLLAPREAGTTILLGGIINLNTNELTVAGSSDILLVGNGMSGNGNGRFRTIEANVVIAPSVTSYVVSGIVHIELASTAQLVVNPSRRISSSMNSEVHISPKLYLNGGGLDGAGKAIVENIHVARSSGGVVGEVRMDMTNGRLDILGDVDNAVNGNFYAWRIRLVNSFTRTIIGRVQTNPSLQLIIGCTTTLLADSAAVLGGRLYLNGQTLNIRSNVVLATSYIYGPGYIRYEEGCNCDLPSVHISGNSATYIIGYPIFQNLIVYVNNTVNLNANTTLEVAGGHSDLLLFARIAGSGSLRIVRSHIYAPNGRIFLTALSGRIYYVDAITNLGTYPISGVQQQVSINDGDTSNNESGECVDDACLRSTLKDLRRQMAGLMSALSNANVESDCSSGLCRGWNSDYSNIVCE